EVAAIDPDLQPFELSLHLPARPLLPANSVSAGLPETPNPLKVAVTPQESLNELRITITDSPEGYWLGAFCFRRPASSSGKAKVNGSASSSQNALLGERVDEWTELKEIFKDVPVDKRELYVAHVAYNEAESRAHVQRLRELLSGGQADPSSIGIDGGFSVQDAVKNEELWFSEQKASEGVSNKNASSTKKGGKNQKQSSEQEQEQKKELFEDFTSWKSEDITQLIPKQARAERIFPQCLRNLSIASWSPPPHQLRMQGHHFYLHIITLEGENLFITACSQGFYVNRSTVHRFEPQARSAPNGEAYASSSLFDVLCAASPLFLANFAKLFQDPISQRDYFAVVPISNCIQAHPWLARQLQHSVDPLRVQSAYLLTGATSADTLDGTRDWNDEIQSTRELPRSSLQERLMRDRVLNRVYAEFTLAAVRAVPRVAAGEVQAMNPMDKSDAQMFIVNNLFISKGVDGVDLYPHMGADEAAHVAVSKDVQGIRCLNNLDVEGVCLLGTVIIDWMGERWVAQSVVPGLFRRRDDEVDEEGNPVAVAEDSKEDTQVVYGGVEGPEVIKDDASFHALFGKVAKSLHLAQHEVADAEKKDHNLWLSVDSKGLRGADGRKYALDLARLNPVDITWLEDDMKGKIISGQDGPEVDAGEKDVYPHRMTLLRQELLEIYWDHELRNWAQAELAAKAKDGEKEGDEAEKPEDKEPERLDASQFKLAFNPDAFVEFKPAEADAEKQIEARPSVLVNDEQDPTVAAVRNASKFLRERALPRLVTDVAIGTHTTQDGRSLTRQMHARGINIRYLGHLAHLTMPSQRHRLNKELLDRAGPGVEGFLLPFRRVAIQEMVVRAAKRILRSLLRKSEQSSSGNVISHFLNCLIGDRVQSSPAPEYTPSPFAGQDELVPEWTLLTPASLQESIQHEVRLRFRFDLPNEYFTQEIQRSQVLREICLRCGIQLKLRQYTLEPMANNAIEANGHTSAGEESPAESQPAQTKSSAGGKKKKQKSVEKDAKANNQITSFNPEDVLNLVPILKESTPRSSLADEAFEAGRVSISRGDRPLGLDLMTEGVSFHEQIYGLVHPETGRCYSTFATVLHHYATVLAVEQAEKQREAEEGVEVPPSELSEQLSVANALRYQRQAVTVSERTLGLDHAETIAQYVNLAVLERLEGNVEASLRCQQRLLQLLEIVHGNDHAEVINALNNVALTLQNARMFEKSLTVYQASYDMAVRMYGKDSINTACLAHELSQAYTLVTDLKKAIEIEKEANKIFEQRLGKEDNMTKESTTLLNNLAASAVRMAKMDARQKEMTRLGLTNQGNRIQSAARQLGTTSAANGIPSANATSSKIEATSSSRKALPDLSNKSLDDLVKFIQGPSPGSS
ncbi:uncharacterized protein FA14DRAFT_108660, partial [Meira miltonrushii]